MAPQPRTWRTLERHPLSAEYEDLTGQAWKNFLDKFKDLGFDPRKPIILAPDEDDDDRMKVGDGWQRQRACCELGIRPVYGYVPRGMTLEQLIGRDNDARRHESDTQREKRLEGRRARVSEAVKEGKPMREIAKDEGISASTVHKDAKATRTPSPRKPQPPANGKPKFDDQRILRILKDVRPVLDKKEGTGGKGVLPQQADA